MVMWDWAECRPRVQVWVMAPMDMRTTPAAGLRVIRFVGSREEARRGRWNVEVVVAGDAGGAS